MALLQRAGSVLALTLLAACADIVGFGGGGPQITRLALFDGTVVAATPARYCIATTVSRPADGFAVMAPCGVINGSDGPATADGFVTVQVGPFGSTLGADLDTLPALLRSDAGKALLNDAGNADSIRVQNTALAGGGATVRFLDLSPPPVTGLQQTEWRGFVDIGSRMATIAVRGLDTAPLGTDDGQILLEQVMQSLQRANTTTALTLD